ncbi:MAG: serine/threonine-protein phosphatase [Rikenellaceae bacterium]|nr:serine/threonine-protein phosphatase [Rikenellaceae bacterium]
MIRTLFTAVVALMAWTLQAQETGMLTDRGRHREANEDHCDTFVAGTGRVCVVCDGVGGAVGGSLASGVAVETFRDWFARNEVGPGVGDIEAGLSDAMRAADEAIARRIAADSTLRGMATTCLLAFIRSDTLWYSHAGDCRLYAFSGGRPVQLTEDDSYMDILIAEGEITPREARRYPLRRAIVNALGVEEMVPHFSGSGYPLRDGELLVMCSDGLYEELSAARMKRILRRGRNDSCDRIARTLVEKANEAGGGDNISVIVIRK